jgi:bifunctional DNA-binding transcriptional regulator/antitoxin component of YhaV-PrlF toxin-antitoxin module
VLKLTILGLASVTKGTANIPKKVLAALGVKTDKVDLVFILDDKGRVYIEKA